MINYSAKDLIEQASMLADLQNSDFIGWKENVMFLDNAWNDMYQQIINHGDKSFLKEDKFSGNEWELPCDFYQLYYVCYNDGLYERPINRRCKTSAGEGPYYDIVENTLKIFNRVNSVREIKVYYFPVRDAITYASEDKSLDSTFWSSTEYTYTFIDCCDKNILYSYPIATGEEEVEKTAEDGTVTKETVKVYTTYYGIYDIINNKSVGSDTTVRFMLTNSGALTETALANPCYKVDNKAYYSVFDSENKVLTVYKNNGTEFFKIEDVEAFDAPLNQINTFTDNGIYYVKDGSLYVFDYGTKKTTVYAEDVIKNYVVSFDNNVYYETTDGVFCNCNLLYSASDYDTFRGVMKVDDKTGYGMLFDTFTLKSSFEDTELLFPNNFYYNYLAYRLAIYYKTKQNADPSGIAVLAEQALKTFYDTLPRDENEFVRISNVYSR